MKHEPMSAPVLALRFPDQFDRSSKQRWKDRFDLRQCPIECRLVQHAVFVLELIPVAFVQFPGALDGPLDAEIFRRHPAGLLQRPEAKVHGRPVHAHEHHLRSGMEHRVHDRLPGDTGVRRGSHGSDGLRRRFTIFEGMQRAMIPAIRGMVLVLAPTLGPTVGGIITQTIDWRWIFFINIAPGIEVTALAIWLVAIDRADTRMFAKIDWSHLVAMAVALAGLEYVLEEGPRHDWFGDPQIVMVTWVAIVAFGLFLERSFYSRNPSYACRRSSDPRSPSRSDDSQRRYCTVRERGTCTKRREMRTSRKCRASAPALSAIP